MATIRLEALPPEEAISFFRQKGYAIGFDYRDVWQQEHQAAFTVAKAMHIDILKDIRGAVDQALANGTTFETFREQLQPTLMRKGWWGRAEMQDPVTNEVKEVQLGSTRRLKTIYDTNLRTAHSEGQWDRIQSAKKRFPYLQYDGNNSEHPRLQHAAWDGMVLPVDDPFWQSHMPVKEWGCKCRVIQMTQGMMDRRGLAVSESPQVPNVTYTNQRTGEVQQVPAGVHPAFHYPPGGRRANLPRMLIEKVIDAPAMEGAAAWADLPPVVAASVATQFRAFVAEAVAGGRSRNKFYVAGVMATDEVDYLDKLGRAPISAEIAVPDKLIVGRKAARHEAAGDALTQAEWERLPAGLAAPRAVLYDTETGNLLYVIDAQDGDRKQKIVVQADFVTKKPKGMVNMVRTGFKVLATDLAGGIKGGKYQVIRGQVE